MIPVWNFYRCNECGAFLVTVDVDKGAVPEFLSCTGRGVSRIPNCKGRLCSAGYPEYANWPEQVPRVPNVEWFRPGEYQSRQIKKKAPKLYQHIINGGLVMRQPTRNWEFPRE